MTTLLRTFLWWWLRYEGHCSGDGYVIKDIFSDDDYVIKDIFSGDD
jgi:hypothetical protein